MNTQDFISKHRHGKIMKKLKYRPCTKAYRVAGEPLLECDDAVIMSGRYTGIRLSDIFIFDPAYLQDYLIKNKYIEPKLKEIAKEVVRNQTKGLDSISRDIALG